MHEFKLIVGLGNPGREYADTRHNAGFWWLDALAQRHGARWQLEAKFQGHLARCTVNGQELFLLKPNTFMNLSGRAVSAVAQFYKIEVGEILVVHDELDLLPGNVKLKLGGGHGGHNGLKDIMAQLSSREFWRLRFGIGHPGDRAAVVNYVLNAPSQADFAAIEAAFERALAVEIPLFGGQTELAMKQLHTLDK